MNIYYYIIRFKEGAYVKKVSVITFLILALTICFFFCSGMKPIVEKIGDLKLGMTKTEVIKIMGNPSSPLSQDFIYGKGKDELIITFDDKQRLDCIIVKGSNLIFSVQSIKIGSASDIIIKKFGKPEDIKKYRTINTEVWGYPNSNVYFTIKNDKVLSFAVSCYNHKELKRGLTKSK